MADKRVVFDVLAKAKADGFDTTHKKITLVAAAATALAVKFGVDSVKAYADAEAKQNQLQNAYKKFPKLADVSIKSLQDLNSAQELKTKFDDDETAAAESVLAQYKLTGAQLTTLVPLMQDYAARTGKDLPTAARDLGKALLGQGKALKGVGINFKDTRTEGGNFNELVTGLRTNVGGFAENEGKTAAGQAKILSNEFGEFKESVGKSAVALGQQLLPPLIKGADWLARNWNTLKPFVIGLGGFAVAILGVNKAMGAWNTIQKVLNATIGANPYVRIAVLIIAIGTALVGAYQHSETFRDVVKGVFTAVETAAKVLALGFLQYLLIPVTNVFSAIVHGAAAAFGWVPGLGPKLKTAAAAFDQFRRDIEAKMAALRASINPPVVPKVRPQWFTPAELEVYRRLHHFATRAEVPIGPLVTPTWNAEAADEIWRAIHGFATRVQVPIGPLVPGPHGHAAGGMFTEGWNRYGEHGPEWAYKRGSTVQMLPTGRTPPGGVGSGVTVLEIRSGGSKMDDLLVEILRRAVRVRGGNVQVALGRG